MTKKIIIDLDDTMSYNVDGNYSTARVDLSILEVLNVYRSKGFLIAINTSRNMRTYNGNVGLINANTLPVIIDWLRSNNVPYDEVYVGKPWCGDGGFYVDDKAIRPAEFVKYKYEELLELIEKDKLRK